jgi:hypothetical protein
VVSDTAVSVGAAGVESVIATTVAVAESEVTADAVVAPFFVLLTNTRYALPVSAIVSAGVVYVEPVFELLGDPSVTFSKLPVTLDATCH